MCRLSSAGRHVCRSDSLGTNAPALPHSSHFRPEASKRQIFVFILSGKTLNAAGPLLLGHVCLFTARKKYSQVVLSENGGRRGEG